MTNVDIRIRNARLRHAPSVPVDMTIADGRIAAIGPSLEVSAREEIDAGSNLVEAVAMPPEIMEAVAQFITEHHVERPFVKRRRQPADAAPAGRGNRENTP